MEYWSIGVLEYWSIGVAERWCFGVLKLSGCSRSENQLAAEGLQILNYINL